MTFLEKKMLTREMSLLLANLGLEPLNSPQTSTLKNSKTMVKSLTMPSIKNTFGVTDVKILEIIFDICLMEKLSIMQRQSE